MLEVDIAVSEPITVARLQRIAEALGITHRVVPGKARYSGTNQIVVASPDNLPQHATPLCPIILVINPKSDLRRFLSAIGEGGVVPLPSQRIGVSSFALALSRAIGEHRGHLAGYLSFIVTPPLPGVFVTAFLDDPRAMTNRRDLCACLDATPGFVRGFLQQRGFERAEHLMTRLRAEAWRWYSETGLPRLAFEDYLGIQHRANFRRACQRAQISAPWDRAHGRTNRLSELK